jgi:phenylacetate-CoA ligase
MIGLARSLNAAVMRIGRRAPDRLLRTIRRFPAPAMDGIRGLALRWTVRLVGERSRFYQDRFAALDIDPRRVRSLADLQACETTSADLRSTAPEDFLCARPELVVESSGTTGRATRVYLSHAELDYSARQGAILFALIGAGPEDRILAAFDYAWGLGGLYALRAGAQSGLFGAFPGLVDPAEAVDRLGDHRFTIVMGDPFWIGRFTEIAMARGVRPPMKAFVSGAERMTDGLRGLIEDYWKAPLFMTYASTELGASLGAECPAKTGYHLHEYDYAVEIRNPDADGYGEVVFTTLTRSVMPLVRYRTGDIARLVPGACACGLPFRRLSAIRGRCDEMVACVWGDVYPEFFEDLLQGIEGVGDEWQVALLQRGLRPAFEFRIETPGGPPSAAGIEAGIRSRLAERHPALWAKTAQQLCDVAVRVVPPDSLRTGRKLRRLLDERGA